MAESQARKKSFHERETEMTENIELSDEKIRALFRKIAQDELCSANQVFYSDTWALTLEFKNKYGLTITPAIGYKRKLFIIKAACEVLYGDDINNAFFRECPPSQSPLANDVQSKLPLTYEQVCEYIIKIKSLPEGGKIEKNDLSSKFDKLCEILSELVETQKELVKILKNNGGKND